MSLISYYGNAYQLGYVARDLEKAMDFLRAKMGVEEFVTRDSELMVTVDGRQQPQSMRVALANVGAKQVEVIQPVSGAVGIYIDGVDYDRSAITFHHIGIAVTGPIAAWTTMEEEVRASGDDFALAFAFDDAGAPQVRYAYVDTRPYCGHYTEYLWWSPSLQGADGTLPKLS